MRAQKVLIITPKFPYPSNGACELDRASGIEWFLKQGYEVRVITKVHSEVLAAQALVKGKELGIPITPVVYVSGQHQTLRQKIKQGWVRFSQLKFWDGAAFEYTDPVIHEAVERELKNFKPAVVWCEYTYLWPLYALIRSYCIPVVTRSHNFEPQHFLEEDGVSFKTPFLYFAKLHSEKQMLAASTVLAAITPRETERYQQLTKKTIPLFTLPLRGLPRCEPNNVVPKTTIPLRVFFMGSTYTVAHNYRAAQFIGEKIVPLIRKKIPNTFVFYILGRKVPKKLLAMSASDLQFPGYIPSEQFDDFLKGMDICLAPSLAGAGMQQKVFEPLKRGFPTITSPRSLAGYAVTPGEEVLLATTAEEFVEQLVKLSSSEVRGELARRAQAQAEELFSQTVIDRVMVEILHAAGLPRQ